MEYSFTVSSITKILAKHRVNVNLTSVYERGMAKPKKESIDFFVYRLAIFLQPLKQGH